MTFRRNGRTIIIVAIISLACASLVSITIFQRSRAAFSSSTSNSGNSWDTGSVALTDNDSGAAMFSAAGLHGGDAVAKCIKVTYSGSYTAGVDVNMYATASGTLAQYLDFKVEIGTGGGSFADCTGFSSASTPYDGTLDDFATTYTSFASGLAIWSPSATPQTKTIKITATVQNDNNAQNTSATAALTWEAQD